MTVATSHTLQHLLDFAVHLASVAAAEILPRFRAGVAIDNKAGGTGFDPVTLADREAEAAMRREIHRVYPDHGVLGEEYGYHRGSSPYTWVLDPIDGTRAFMLGQLHWGVLIALNDGPQPVIGLMHQPYTGELFIGSPLGAQWRRGADLRALAARPQTRLADAILCATDPTMFTPERRRAFDRVAAQARGVRWGGDCYTPCLVAAGCADLVIEAHLKPWDVQPLVPIVERAGAVISSWTGERAAQADEMVIASNRSLHAEVLALLNA